MLTGKQRNTDITDRHDPEKVIFIDDRCIFITHGDRYDLEQDHSGVIEKGVSVNADIILFRHTRKPCLQNSEGGLDNETGPYRTEIKQEDTSNIRNDFH